MVNKLTLCALTALACAASAKAEVVSILWDTATRRIVSPTNLLGMTFNGTLVTNLAGTGLTISGNVLQVNTGVIATDAEVAAAYQPLDADLTKLATLDGGSLTNLNGTEIRSGTVAEARIDSALARLAGPTFTGDPKAPTPTAGDNDESIATTAYVQTAISGFGSSYGGVSTNGGTTFTPDFGASKAHEFTLTGNTTLDAATGVTTNMLGETFRLVFVQDSTGIRTLITATNYLFGTDITGATLSTNAGARDYMAVYVRRTNVFDVIGFVRGYSQ